MEREGSTRRSPKRLFEKLVSVKPDFDEVTRLFASAFANCSAAKIRQRTVDSFETCLKKRKDWPEALLNLGLACWKFEDLDAATDTFHRVLALQPKNTDALRALIAIAIDRKDHKRAWDLLQKLNAAGDRSVELSYNLGLLLQAAGENKLAAECYQIAIEKKPEFSEAC